MCLDDDEIGTLRKNKRGYVRVATERIERRILLIRGHKVMLDFDLAELYGVPTKALNQAVSRNRSRFLADFMFQLTREELAAWRSQFVTSNPGLRMGLRRPPYAFTEHGIAMLSSVLKSERAVQVNIAIVRAFVRMRQLVASNVEFARRLAWVERWVKKQRPRLSVVYKWVSSLITTLVEDTNKEPIGFTPPKKKMRRKK